MCEVNAYKLIGSKETLLMEQVDEIIVKGNNIALTNLKGEKKMIKGKIKKIDFLDHKLVIIDDK